MRLRLAFAGPEGVIYGVNDAGDLLWFQVKNPTAAHTDLLYPYGDSHWHWIDLTGDARNMSRPKSWDSHSAEVIASATWIDVAAACAADSGVIYAIKADRHLYRSRFTILDGWTTPLDLGGPRWDLMWDLLSGGDGLLYARDRHGVLYRFRDSDPMGTPKLPLRVDTISGGWNRFSKVLAGPRGVLYAMEASTGQLLQFDDVSGDGSGFHASAGRPVTGPGLSDDTERSEDWRRHSYYFSDGDGTIYGIRPPSMTRFFPALEWFRRTRSSWEPGSGNAITYDLQIAELEGYCTPYTARPSEQPVSFCVSTSRAAAISVRYHRLSFFVREHWAGAAFPGHAEQIPPFRHESVLEGGDPVATTPGLEVCYQAARDDAWDRGCEWLETFQLRTAAPWRSGVYAAQIRDQRGFECLIPFVVPARDPETDVLTLFNTNTWNAYNYWGGQSYYFSLKRHDATRLTFARPNHQIFGGVHEWNDRRTGVNHALLADLWIYGWLEGKGYASDAMTDYDLHRSSPVALSRYKVIVLTAHPEYWSTEMYDNLQGYLDRGGNLLYLGGNGVYFRIEFNDDGLALGEIGPRVRLREYVPPVPPRDGRTRHERKLLGVAFFPGGYDGDNASWSRPYHVRAVAGRREAETVMAGFAIGERLGREGFNGKASGIEVDRALVRLAAPRTGESEAEGATEFGVQSPIGTTVLASGTQRGLEDGNMVMFRYPDSSDPRGLVFSAGSIAFGGALWLDERLGLVLERALRIALDLPPR